MITRDTDAIEEFPFTNGNFYRNTVKKTDDLKERKEVQELICTVNYDIQIASKYFNNTFVEAKYVVYFPIEKTTNGIKVMRGDVFSGDDMYGLRVNGEVLGINPSQLGGVEVYIKDIDV